MCCKDFTESLCLYIQNKICIMEILHTLVITLNMNEDENEEKIYIISNNFIKTFTGWFLLYLVKSLFISSLEQDVLVLNMAKLTCLYSPM